MVVEFAKVCVFFIILGVLLLVSVGLYVYDNLLPRRRKLKAIRDNRRVMFALKNGILESDWRLIRQTLDIQFCRNGKSWKDVLFGFNEYDGFVIINHPFISHVVPIGNGTPDYTLRLRAPLCMELRTNLLVSDVKSPFVNVRMSERNYGGIDDAGHFGF